MDEVRAKSVNAKNASKKLRMVDVKIRNAALFSMADALIANKEIILKENKKDIVDGHRIGLSEALIDRLLVDEKRLLSMAEGLRQVARHEDPLADIISGHRMENGLEIINVRVPLGVIGMIYESRPNVTVDAAGLAIKSGNSIILRGGEEAINTNIILWKIISSAAYSSGIPLGAVEMIETLDRDAVGKMLKMQDLIDVIIPRGGNNLINRVKSESIVPVIQTGVGVCHVYVDETADFDMALDIIENAKVQRPAVCNAVETVLVHEKIAYQFLPLLKERLDKSKVELRGCRKTLNILKDIEPALDADWDTEYGTLILSIKTVGSLSDAIEHIDEHGTKHSESIITKDYFAAKQFETKIDAAAVYINSSTRFTDGEQFGMGSEIGISTQKLHVRGPMGLKELTTNKYIIHGEGQIRK